MNITDATVLITGANRGIGRAFVERFASSGARRVYAGARDASSLNALVAQYPGKVVAIQLDVTDRGSIAAAAAAASDINVLINNAGTAYAGGITSREHLGDARREMEVNYFGVLEMSRAFSPILAKNAPSAIVNILSIASVIGLPAIPTYSASKAAALSATRALRAELSPKGVRVIGVMPGFVDTDMARAVTESKMTTDEVVSETIDALSNGVEDIYPGTMAQNLVAAFFSDHKALEKQLSGSGS
jgi:short-subunit dehydrogenase